MTDIEKVNEFLTQAKTFYLATVEGDHPKCRPLGFHMVSGGRLYFGVGEFKEVYRQMQENPKVELCATCGGEFLRYYGRAVFETDHTLARQIVAASPFLQGIYNEETGRQLGVFHLENATAEFRGMLEIKESLHFA